MKSVAVRCSFWLVQKSRLLAFALALGGVAGCSDDAQPPPRGDGGGDLAPALDAGGGEQLAGSDQGGAATLPAIPAQSGVVYVAHYHSSELRWYRVDGDAPQAGGTLELGQGRVTHDMDLDPYHDRLYLVSDAARSLDIFQLQRPGGPAEPVVMPQRLTSLTLELLPLFVKIDPLRERLYVVASPAAGGGSIANFQLLVYDVSSPASPVPVAGSPFSIPTVRTVALDYARGVLFLVSGLNSILHAYDLHGDQLTPLPGAPLDLAALYPEENMYTFQARQLTADPYRNRLYAGRAQGVLSELIVIEYPAALPPAGSGYGSVAAMDQFQKIQGPFDLSKPIEQRPHLLSAFTPSVDLLTGAVLLVAAGYHEPALPALMVSISPQLELGSGCGDFEGFGCWYRSHLNGEPLGFAITDGAGCVDYARGVAVGTTIDPGDETQQGTLLFFRYQADLSMSPWLPAGGGDLIAGSLPVAAVCH